MNGRRPGAENADHGKNSKPSNQAPARRAPSERGVNQQRAPDRAIVMITHYQRLLGYVEPDRVHVLQDGRIVESGDKSLAAELERRGYGAVGDAA